LEDIQRCVNLAARNILKATAHIPEWTILQQQQQQQQLQQQRLQKPLTQPLAQSDAPPRTLFDTLGCDLDIIKTLLLLTGALHATAESVRDYLASFRRFDWLWKEDKSAAYKTFHSAGKPLLVV
jgi:dynein heavy chain, axonemal